MLKGMDARTKTLGVSTIENSQLKMDLRFGWACLIGSATVELVKRYADSPLKRRKRLLAGTAAAVPVDGVGRAC